MSIAVGIKGGGAGSRRAFRWAVDNLVAEADRFLLIHVIPTITSIPTPSGDHIPIEDLDANIAAMFVQDMKVKYDDIFLPFKKLCKTKKIETLVVEGDDPASALLRYVSNLGIKSLVLGSLSYNCITRKLYGPGVPETVLQHASGTCNIYVVYKHRLVEKLANPLLTNESSSKQMLLPQRQVGSGSISELPPGLDSSRMEYEVPNSFGTNPNSQAFTYESSSTYSSTFQGEDSILEYQTLNGRPSLSSTSTEQTDVQAEVEQLRLELRDTVAMYNRACEDLVHAQKKVHVLSSDCLEESRKVNAAVKREESIRKIASEEKEKHLKAVKEVETARLSLAELTYERQISELGILKESLEKKRIVDLLYLSDQRYRRYTKDEIETATDFFSETKVIGEGAYGKVYKCNLDHIPVAIKVLRPDALEKKEEFLREVEVLSHLRHPNMILLLGACPEIGCLVYEFMENGSLDDHIYHRKGTPLPWPVRFRILFEVACGLSFLHNSKPEPIVHRDLKPGNILLDKNYVSKIGDVGLAKLISVDVPDNVTKYTDSVIAGTFFYMDPEYQRTGTIRPKSDLYAFGIIILQLLAGRHPKGLLMKFENAISQGSLLDVLDKSISDWPLVQAEQLAKVGLRCSELRCRERPDLETEVLPILKIIADFAESSIKVERNNTDAPRHFYCPILQEIMDDPHIAADGFTYEHKAIKLWVERHNISPVTKHRLQNTFLIPNRTLRSAIQERRLRETSSRT